MRKIARTRCRGHSKRQGQCIATTKAFQEDPEVIARVRQSPGDARRSLNGKKNKRVGLTLALSGIRKDRP